MAAHNPIPQPSISEQQEPTSGMPLNQPVPTPTAVCGPSIVTQDQP